MEDLGHLTPKKINAICTRIFSIRGSLRGIGALLEQQTDNPYYEPDDLSGLGQFCKILSDQLDRIEDILRCGYDSCATEDLKDNGKFAQQRRYK